MEVIFVVVMCVFVAIMFFEDFVNSFATSIFAFILALIGFGVLLVFYIIWCLIAPAFEG